MKKIISLFLFISIFVITTFLLFADFEKYVEGHLNDATTLWTYSGLSFIFLLSDIVFPVPSSLIMILNGKVLGFTLGAILSSISGIVSSSIGFLLGRRSEKYLNRIFKPEEVIKANNFANKYGKFSVSLSRAIPILSETLAVLMGTTKMKYKDFLIYSSIGHLIVSVFYAGIGSFAKDVNGYLVTALVVISTLIISWGTNKLLILKEV